MKIHQVKTRLVNTYVVEYPDRLLVMDVAIKCHRYVLGFIEHELGRDIHDVELVICSHDDPDHMGGVRSLAVLCEAAMGVPKHSGISTHKLWNDPLGPLVRGITLLGEATRSRMWDMYFNPQRNKRARQQPRYEGKKNLKGRDRAYYKERAKSFYRFNNGECLPGFDDWQVIHTPGHSWDSCCYYHASSGSLLTGDTLLGSAKEQRVVVPSIYANVSHRDQTLEKLRALSVTSVYPGHGAVIHSASF